MNYQSLNSFVTSIFNFIQVFHLLFEISFVHNIVDFQRIWFSSFVLNYVICLSDYKFLRRIIGEKLPSTDFQPVLMSIVFQLSLLICDKVASKFWNRVILFFIVQVCQLVVTYLKKFLLLFEFESHRKTLFFRLSLFSLE